MRTEDEGSWTEVGDGVLARRYTELDLTVGLVLGGESCLVVDTRGDAVRGAELAAAVREVTALPWSVALTHAHFDHAFGTSAFLPCAVWAHEGCHADLVTDGERQRTSWERSYRDEGKPEIADAIRETEIVLPDCLVTERAELELGGRRVALEHLGAGHTGHDLVVHVPDENAVFAGDLVEVGPDGTYTAESFGTDTVLDRWPGTLEKIVELAPKVVVPGHGAPVDADFVARQRVLLAELAALAAAVGAGELAVEGALARSPFPPEVTRRAVAG